jgi:hypothetical protein
MPKNIILQASAFTSILTGLVSIIYSVILTSRLFDLSQTAIGQDVFYLVTTCCVVSFVLACVSIGGRFRYLAYISSVIACIFWSYLSLSGKVVAIGY